MRILLVDGELQLAREESHAHTDAEMCRRTSELLARYFDAADDGQPGGDWEPSSRH
jgi:hypothetical protein